MYYIVKKKNLLEKKVKKVLKEVILRLFISNINCKLFISNSIFYYEKITHHFYIKEIYTILPI